jgi:hypothetical protein
MVVVSFMLLPLCPEKTATDTSSIGGWVGPKNWSSSYGLKKNFLPAIGHPAHGLVSISTELS